MPSHHYLTAIIYLGKSRYVGTNSYKTSPRFAKSYPSGYRGYTRHAEEHALSLVPVGADLAKAVIEVYRVRKSGQLGLARPCHHCAKLLFDAGLKVFYSTDDGIMVEMRKDIQ